MTSGGRLNLSPERLKLLASMLRTEGIERPAVEGVTPRSDPAAPVPLTVSQTQMWFLDHVTVQTSTYVIAGALRVFGPFDLDAFARACEEVVRRHESLRTVFLELDRRPFQQVRDDLRPEVGVHDLSGLAADAAQAEVRRRHAELAARPFDLSTGPLLRMQLLRLGPDEAAVLLSMHHIVSDQWSMGVLMRELMALYAAVTGGRRGDLPELRVQYPDFALWQHRTATDAGWRADLDYWTERLAGAPSETGLPTDRPRPAEKTYRGSSVPIELPAELVARLRALARAEGATVFMVLAAAFKVLLYRLSGTEDIVVGTPLAGRPRAELEPLIGYFVNTLVLRTDASGNPTFREFVGRVAQVCLEAYEHQGLPFERLVEELRPERTLSRSPVFQVMFTYQNAPFPGWSSGPVRVEPVPLESGTSKFDLTLDLFEDDPTVWGRLVYSTDIFGEDRARTMVTYLYRLLVGLTADPDQRIGQVPLLDEAERREVLARSRGPVARPPAAGGVHELIAAQASTRPDATAVVCGPASLTYAELEVRANRLAHHLRGMGVQPGLVVGLCLPGGVDLITAIVGAWKAGAAYLPLDAGYPVERLEFMLGDSRAAAVVAAPEVAGQLTAAPVVRLDDPALAGAPIAPPPIAVRPEQVAYVIYTSGSTGQPKGVHVTHRGLLSYLGTVPGRAGLGAPGGRYALLQGAVTDFGNTLIFTSLVTGGELHVLEAGMVTDPDAVADYLAHNRIDYLKVVPSHLAALAAQVGPARLIPARTLVMGGEPASPRQVAELLAVAGDRKVVNHYGPTETTIGVATVQLTPELLAGGVVPIGAPLANTNLYVLDPYLNPVPVGVAGELFVGGPQVARGYGHRPALTAERFIPDPFAGDGSRLYRTGDRVQWTTDGVLQFLGRIDDQVKIRGFRVEPREIEACLAAHPAVNRAIVTAREDTPGVKQLVGYVTPAGDPADLDPSVLRAHLGRTLPEYLVPAAVVVLDTFPLTINGKIDRRRLPGPEFTTAAGSRRPATPVEELLCDVFARVLGLPEVGADDGFFALGGDSIQAIQLVSGARAAGLTINTRDVFIHQTAAGLARVARQSANRATVGHDGGEGEVEPTPMVERLRQLDARIDGYSHSVLVAVPPTDRERLAAALRAALDHHGALRARLVELADGRWSLLVGRAGSVSADAVLHRVHVSGLDEAAFDRVRGEQAAAAVARLDPFAGGMVQAVWFDAGSDAPGRLLLVIHHLVVDGVSWRILLEDLRQAWESVAAGRAVALAPVGTSLRRWACLLATEAGTPARRAELPAWQDIGRDATPLVTGRHDPNGPVHQLTVALPAADAVPLLAVVPAAFRAGIQDVLLAAFGIALAEWQRRRGRPGGVVVEVEGHGRNQDLVPGVDLSRSVGWFTSIHPVRMDPGPLTWPQVDDAGVELRDALLRLIAALRAVPGDGLGYGLLRYLNPETASELAALPVPQVVFNYLGRVPASAAARPWEPLATYAVDDPGADAATGTLLARPLAVNALAVDAADGPQLVATWMWAGELGADEVTALAEIWFAALRALTACAARPGMALPASVGSEPTAGTEPTAGSEPTADTEPATRTGPSAAERRDAIPAVDRGGELPLSFAQLNNVYQPVGHKSAHHNVVSAFVLTGELDEVALRYSLDGIVRRHEVLRTRVLRRETGWVQIVNPSGEWPLDVVDLTGCAHAARVRRLREAITDAENRPLDLVGGTPLRATLARTAPQASVLLMVLHHIVIDPWGYGQLQRELAELYAAHTEGREPRLPELCVQYGDFAVWQQARLAGGALAENVAYWREALRSLPPVPQFDAPGHQKTEAARGYTHGVVFDAEFTRRLKDSAQRAGLTPFILLLAAYHALLATYTGSEDISVSFPMAGRERPEVQHLIGYFINAVVVRSDQSRTQTFRDLAEQVRDRTLDAHAHQEVPLRSLDGGISTGYNPFRVMFNLVSYAPVPLDLPGLRTSFMTEAGEDSDESLIPELVTAMKPYNVDIYLAMHERDGQLGGIWLYSPERIEPTVMAAMMRCWPALLETVVREPQIPLAELRRRLLLAQS